ncbi:MAG: prolipoprotein diacylglyceryl transferase [Anaerolineales bacterium]|jgi:phosphatidylglycerol:prolipoprotein diacylglycerol transferase|nr:prolipoprotein diacylglyceryl transferase [Anaerolineales bacterium]
MPEGFDIFGWTVHFYGIIIMFGVVLGGMLAAWRAKEQGHDPEIVWDLLIWLVIGGVIGARLWHVFTPPPSAIAAGLTSAYYLTHPLDLIAIWQGGLGIPGAVIGGAIAMYFFTRKRKLSFAEWADIAAPSLALGQAIGRWGNFINQELYGAPTNLPWAITIAPEKRVSGFAEYATYHPLFLYESLWNLGNLIFLLWLSRRFGDRLSPGDLFLTYLVTYPIGRFLLDFLRLDASMLGGINANQTFMAIVAILAAGTLIWRQKQRQNL